LLTAHIGELRAAFRETRARHPFTTEAIVVLPDYRHAVHINPVKHGLVTRVRDWPHSSFHRMVKDGVYPEDWAGDVSDRDEEYGERR
jgi:hypothetical protein